jgi:hypothetical protein
VKSDPPEFPNGGEVRKSDLPNGGEVTTFPDLLGCVGTVTSSIYNNSNIGGGQKEQTAPPADAGLHTTQNDEGDFQKFWAAFPKGRKQGKGATALLFEKIVAGKHKVGRATAQELIDAATAYAKTSPDPEFTPAPSTWLNGGRWMDDVSPTKASGPWWTDRVRVQAVTADRWRTGIREHAGAVWPISKLGPPPGQPSCVVPAEIIAELGLAEAYDHKGMRRK